MKTHFYIHIDMMRLTEKLGVICAVAFLCGTCFATWKCPKCHETNLDTDTYCPYCIQEINVQPSGQSSTPPTTDPRPGYDHSHEYGDDSSVALDRLAGTGRGLATIVLSPLNVARGVATGFNWLFSRDGAPNGSGGSSIDGGDLGPLGAVLAGGAISFCVAAGATLGTITTCADVTNGTFDMISVGYYGDWLYDSEVSGKPTPWIWKRKWYSSQFPWINKE